VQDTARDAPPARSGRRPHPLDFSDALVDATEPAAVNRSAIEASEDKEAVGRRHLFLGRRVATAGIEAALETCREFPEICGEATPHRSALRRDDPKFDCGRPDQPLDFRHRIQQTKIGR
jgi:hypothetical protein